jgi:hypothetical protein
MGATSHFRSEPGRLVYCGVFDVTLTLTRETFPVVLAGSFCAKASLLKKANIDSEAL